MALNEKYIPNQPRSDGPPAAALRRIDADAALARLGTQTKDVPIALPQLPRWDELAPWMRRIDRGNVYTNRGPLVCELERRLERHYRDCETLRGSICLTSSGTAGLTATLLALNLPVGALCAMPSWTFVATATAVLAAGLKPFLIDVDLNSWALEPETLSRELRDMPERPAAVVVVSPFGAPLDPEKWRAFSVREGIKVVFDAAAGFDSVVPSKIPAVVSLHATKPLGVGEGGFVLSCDPELITRIRQISNFGFSDTRIAHLIGTNAKLSEYHAAIGLAALQKWPQLRKMWQRVLRTYRDVFAERSDLTIPDGCGDTWVSSSAVFRFHGQSAVNLSAHLTNYRVASRRWWQRGVAHHPAFAETLRSAELPNSDRLARETLALPCYPALPSNVVHSIGNAVAAILDAENGTD